MLNEIAIEGECPPLVPEGEYEFAFQYHRTMYLYGRCPKVYCYFKIVTMGPHFDTVLPRYYNVRTLESKPRKGGAFRVGWHSDFIREYATLFGLPDRLDRISTEALRNVIVRGRVETVKQDSRQRRIPEPLRYSVISEILERVQ